MDYFEAKKYLICLPSPVFIVSVKSGKILYANRQAERRGIYAGISFFRMMEDNAYLPFLQKVNEKEPKECSIGLRIDDRLYKSELFVCGARYKGMQSWFFSVSSLEEAYSQNTMSVISQIGDIFLCESARKTHDFLALTAQSTGAFCASLYEKRNQRFVLKEEWRETKNVCIPVLAPNFEENALSELERIGRLKRAVDSAYAVYRKNYGTSGVVLYFFEREVSPQVKKNIEKYIGLYGILSPDTPENSVQFTAKKGLDSISSGVAVWDADTRELLFHNKAYRNLFGKRNGLLSEILAADMSYRSKKASEENLADIKGNRYCVSHTPAKICGHDIVATVINDITRYREAETKLELMARTDALTGLLNRRAGTERLEAIYLECKKEGTPLTVCFADIDGLKSINDKYGHGEGDNMIRFVADVLRGHLNSTGEVCRLGGDEFVLILPGTDKEQAMLLSARIARDIKKCVVGESHGVSMSFGFTQADYSEGETAGALVNVADKDMYREKSRKAAK
jgi:diguanylate cyclase (GGDEF)-like protein